MANVLDRNFDFATNGTVTAAGLHNLIDETNIYAGLISTQEEKTTVGTSDLLLVADSSSISSPQIAANRTTVYNLFEDALTGGTYVNAQLSGNLTYGTATGQRTVSTSATITTGTIATLNSTTGTIATLNSTTGTITNLSTTLAGDLTISQGTATLSTTGATAATYGTTNAIPRITVDAKGRVTAASTVTAPVGFRNRIINGDMRIDQRNAGASGTAAGYTVDRFAYFASQASKGTWQQNSGSVPPPAGYVNYLGFVSSSNYSVLVGDTFGFHEWIEGFNIADLDFGKATAKTITLSFWVRSSLTGTFGASLMNGSDNRSYPFNYTISSANTWEYKTETIAGDTSGTWASGNTAGLLVRFGLGSGSTYSGTAGSWTAGNLVQPTGSVSVVGTNGATFYITGVQLEAGSTATEFERRPIGTELALCQRYYEKGTFHSAGYIQINAGAGGSIYFKSEKRAAPTMTYTNTVTINVGVATTNQTIATDSVSLYRIASSSAPYQYEQTWTAEIDL